MKPSDIIEKKFVKSKVFGYKTNEVDTFLDEVYKEYENLHIQRDDLENKVNFLAEKLTEYRGQENKLADVLLEAKKVSDNMLKKARDKADLILSDAKIKADKMINNAKREADQQQILFLKLQREVTLFRNKILSQYKSQMDLITSLPVYSFEESKEQSDLKNVNIDEIININSDRIEEEISPKVKERTLSISLDKNGKPIKIKGDDIAKTKSISLKKDQKINDENNQDLNNIERPSKFREPLKFGSAYNIKSDKKLRK